MKGRESLVRRGIDICRIRPYIGDVVIIIQVVGRGMVPIGKMTRGGLSHWRTRRSGAIAPWLQGRTRLVRIQDLPGCLPQSPSLWTDLWPTTLPQLAACLACLTHYPTYRRRRRHITLTPPCRHRTLRQHTNSEPTESLKIQRIKTITFDERPSLKRDA